MQKRSSTMLLCSPSCSRFVQAQSPRVINTGQKYCCSSALGTHDSLLPPHISWCCIRGESSTNVESAAWRCLNYHMQVLDLSRRHSP